MYLTIRSHHGPADEPIMGQSGIMTEHTNEVTGEAMFIPWRTSPWGEILQKSPTDIFGEVNDLIAQLDKEGQEALWQSYKRAHDIIIGVNNRHERDEELRHVIQAIIDLFPVDVVTAHLAQYEMEYEDDMAIVNKPLGEFLTLIQHENIPAFTEVVERLNAYEMTGNRRAYDLLAKDLALEVFADGPNAANAAYGIPVKLGAGIYSTIVNPVYPEAQTYNEHEYTDLLTLIFYFKVTSPIIGTYAEAVKDEVGTPHKEIKSFELFEDTSLFELPAMQKLYRYCEAWAFGKTASSDASFTIGIPTEDVPRYLLSMLCINRMPQYKLQERGLTFIRYMYRFIRGRSNEISKGAPRTKDLSNRAGDEESDGITEQYRIAERYPSFIPDSQTIQLWGNRNTTREEGIAASLAMARGLMGDEIDVPVFRGYVNRLMDYDRFYYSSFHMPIMKLVLSDIVYPEALLQSSRDAMLSAVAITAYYLTAKGFDDIAQLILAQREERDEEEMAVSGIQLNPLHPDKERALASAYPYLYVHSTREKPKNPGVLMIDSIVITINRYNWNNLPLSNLTDIRNSIARLLTTH